MQMVFSKKKFMLKLEFWNSWRETCSDFMICFHKPIIPITSTISHSSYKKSNFHLDTQTSPFCFQSTKINCTKKHPPRSGSLCKFPIQGNKDVFPYRLSDAQLTKLLLLLIVNWIQSKSKCNLQANISEKLYQRMMQTINKFKSICLPTVCCKS